MHAAGAAALAIVFAAGTLTGCTLQNPFSTSAPETIQDSAPIEVISETEAVESEAVEASVKVDSVVDSAPDSVAEPVATPIPTVVAQVLTPTPTPALPTRVLGDESEAETTFKVTLENGTGQDIVYLGVRVRSDGKDSASYMSESEPFVPNEKVVLYYDASYAIKEAKEYGDIVEYQIRFTAEDDNYYVIHDFPFGEAVEARLVAGSGYAYIVYKTAEGGQEISTAAAERENYGIEEEGEEETTEETDGSDEDNSYQEDEGSYDENDYDEGDDGSDNYDEGDDGSDNYDEGDDGSDEGEGGEDTYEGDEGEGDEGEGSEGEGDEGGEGEGDEGGGDEGEYVDPSHGDEEPGTDEEPEDDDTVVG